MFSDFHLHLGCDLQRFLLIMFILCAVYNGFQLFIFIRIAILQLILLFILIWVARQRLPATPATQNGPEPYTVVYRLISSVQNEIVLNALIRLT